jgi:hypothetical protein
LCRFRAQEVVGVFVRFLRRFNRISIQNT